MDTLSLERTTASAGAKFSPERSALALSASFGLELGSAGLRVRERAALRRVTLYQQQAREARRRNEEMLDILGDQLRNPLAALMLSVQLMKARGHGPDRLCETLERQVHRLTTLVNELIEAAAVSRGAVGDERQRIEVHALVRDALAEVMHSTAEPAARIEVDTPEAGLVVEGDLSCLRRALVHVLDNAFKFNKHDRHGHVRIVTTGDQGDVLIRVSDDGAGVDQDRLSEIFEPFVQGRPPPGERLYGLGLGLTIVRQVVEHHGGSVRALSAGAGRGCEIQNPASARSRHVGRLGPR